MFKCQSCGKQTQTKEPQYHEVVETCVKQYPEGTQGLETVKELHVCEECYYAD